MQANAHFSAKRRQKLDADNATEDDDGLRGIVVDEHTLWTAKPLEFLLTNASPYERWYRVSVTDLTVEEYVLYTDQQQICTEDFVAAAPQAQVAFTLVLGGTEQKQPRQPRRFSIIVMEFSLPEENAPYTTPAR